MSDGNASRGRIKMNTAVFLDRDNTLIHNDGDLGDPSQVKLIQGAASAVASLKGLGFRVVVVTNQGGVARGKYGEAQVNAVNERINELVKAVSGVPIDRFYYCPYHPEGTVEEYRREHPWRKPQPGMLLQAAQDLDLDLSQCWMVGDQQRDTDAGAAAGVKTILLTPHAEELSPLRLEQIAKEHERRLQDGEVASPMFTARNMVEAVRIIAQQRKPEIAAEAARNRDRGGKRWDAQAVRARQVQQAEPPAVSDSAEIPAPTYAKPWDESPKPTGAPEREIDTAINTAPPASSSQVDSNPAQHAERESGPAATPVPARDRAVGEDETLRQILQELRNQRAHAGDFSYTKFLAVILQMVALCLFIGALWLGSAEGRDTYVQWMTAALFVQLTVLAALLFNR